MHSTLGLLFLVFLASSVASIHATPSSSSEPFAASHLVALQQENPNDSDVTVFVYDPFTADGLRSTPLPEWFTSSPSNPLAIDVTSSKAVNWIDSNGDGHVSFIIANNDTIPTQAFMDYIYYEAGSGGYIEPAFQSGCFFAPSPSAPSVMYRDLLLVSPTLATVPVTFGATVDTIMPDGSFNATQFQFVNIYYPSGSPTSFPACNIYSNELWSKLPVQVPYSLSAASADSMGQMQWAYVSFSNSSSGQLSYDISFVPLFADATPDSIPLTGLQALERFPPPAPWFSLQLFADPRDGAEPLSYYLVNAVDVTVWYITPGAAAQQIVYQTGKHAKVIVPTLPFVAVPLVDATRRRSHHIKRKQLRHQSNDFNSIVFLWLNDYKQLVGVTPSNDTIAIKGVNMPALTWGEKLMLHSDNSQFSTIVSKGQ